MHSPIAQCGPHLHAQEPFDSKQRSNLRYCRQSRLMAPCWYPLRCHEALSVSVTPCISIRSWIWLTNSRYEFRTLEQIRRICVARSRCWHRFPNMFTKCNSFCFSRILSCTQVKYMRNHEDAYLNINMDLHVHHTGGFEHHFSSNETYSIFICMGASQLYAIIQTKNLLFAPVRWWRSLRAKLESQPWVNGCYDWPWLGCVTLSILSRAVWPE